MDKKTREKMGMNPDIDKVAMEIAHSIYSHNRTPYLFADSTAVQEESKIVERALHWMEEGFKLDSYRYELNTPFNWDTPEGASRNHRYKIQAWIMIDELLRASILDSKIDFLSNSRNIALDWIDQFLFGEGSDEFCWYDMGTGQRASLLAYITHKTIIEDFVPKKILSKSRFKNSNPNLLKLIISAEIHMLELMSEERLAIHSNHGLFQMAGLLALSSSIPMTSSSKLAKEFAIEKIELMLSEHFFEDGFHKEHSPMYHMFMSNFLFQLKSAGWLKDSGVLESLSLNAIRSTGKYIMPNGYFVPLGDSNMRYSADALCLFNVHFDNNNTPSCPPGLHIFEQGGVAVLATNDESEIADEHLVFSAQFHSRQHKHADDLSINYCIRGKPYLIDAGTFTYHYDQRERMYVESTKAHNTIEIDGMNNSRFRLAAYGSALTKSYQIGECTVLEAIITHKHLVPADIPNNRIKTTDGTPVNVYHKRLIIQKSKSFLAVIDLLDSKEQHDFSQWFHLSPELKLEKVGENTIDVLKENGTPHSVIHIIPQDKENPVIDIFHGQDEPELIGWHSTDGLELSPNFSLSNQISGQSVQFCTVFSHDPKSRMPFINVSSNGRYIRFSNKNSDDLFDITIRDNTNGKYEVTCITDGEELEKVYNWD